MSAQRPRQRAPAPRQVSFTAPEGSALLHLVRENLRLVAQLAAHYEVGLGADADADVRTIRSPADVAGYLGPELADLAQEQLRVVLLDSKNHVLGASLVYQGGLNASVVRLADCFRDAVRVGAASIILCHNHPSHDPTPSPEDVRVTAEVARAGDLLGIELLDHVVVGKPGYVSLRERGLYVPGTPRTLSPAGPAAGSRADGVPSGSPGS